MMKSLSPVILLFFSALPLLGWQPAEHTMLTEWGEQVTPENAWTEYPRPQMVREQWQNLNGLWNYAVTSNRAMQPNEWKDEILVPFALETPLSGVGKRLESNEVIWYQRTFESKQNSGRQLLHFEGVDYKCMVWVNGELAGSHIGGNLPFAFDVSELIKEGENELMLRVVDGTDDPDLYQLRGKQKRDNKGIWYTPSSGIWATVWLETVPDTYISSLKLLGNMEGELKASVETAGKDSMVGLRVSVLEDGTVLQSREVSGKDLRLSVKHAKLWSPDSPNLYDLKVELLDAAGQVIDTVDSYVGFRSVGKVCDEAGNWRFTLNGEEIFHLGPLDQGWWPGSFLTPPADEAIAFEMQFLKDAGFNMIRKHKKAEPRRYYYHADRLGFLIWQDQTSGGSGSTEWPKWKKLRALSEGYSTNNKNWWTSEDDLIDAHWPHWAHELYMDELKCMIDTLYNHPSVVVWTTFNERWGQHQSLEVGKWVESYDPSRHLNIASGGNFFEVGDIADEHNYPHPAYPLEQTLYDDYIKVVGEYGGHGWAVQGHLWDTKKKNWGYGGLPKTIEEYTERYTKSSEILGELKEKGVAAGVYTQTTDVEGEINGLMTYDRKVLKMEAAKIREIHEKAGLLD